MQDKFCTKRQPLNVKQTEQQKKLGEEKIKFDFTKQELDFIVENANFTEIQQAVFNRLTDRKGRQSIVQISLEENLSTAIVSRIIKKIKKKIIRVI